MDLLPFLLLLCFMVIGMDFDDMLIICALIVIVMILMICCLSGWTIDAYGVWLIN